MSGKIALIIECGSQGKYKVPIECVHRFEENKHTSMQAYKFDDPQTGDVRYGTITCIANSEKEMDTILSSCKRQRKPPERLVISAAETTDYDSDHRTEDVSKRKAQENTVKNNLDRKLIDLKEMQANNRTRSMSTLDPEAKLGPRKPSGSDLEKLTFDEPACKNISGTMKVPKRKAQEDTIKKNFNGTNLTTQTQAKRTRSMNTSNPETEHGPRNPSGSDMEKLTVDESAQVNLKGRTSKFGTMNKQDNLQKQNFDATKPRIHNVKSINKKLPLTITKSRNTFSKADDVSQPPASKKVGFDKENFVPPKSIIQSSPLVEKLVQRTERKILQAQKHDENMKSSLQICQRKLENAKNEIKVLNQKLENYKNANLQLLAKWKAQSVHLKKLTELNVKWQEVAINKCEAIHAMFTETNKALKERNEDSLSLPSGYQDADQVHLGRGIWISADAYLLAAHGIQYSTRQKFVKRILVAVFGYDVLATSTISGKGSNRNGEYKKPIGSLDPKKLLAIKGPKKKCRETLGKTLSADEAQQSGSMEEAGEASQSDFVEEAGEASESDLVKEAGEASESDLVKEAGEASESNLVKEDGEPLESDLVEEAGDASESDLVEQADEAPEYDLVDELELDEEAEAEEYEEAEEVDNKDTNVHTVSEVLKEALEILAYSET